MTPRYWSGEEVRLGDLVDIGEGNGPILRVVVIPQLGLAAAGFDVQDWKSSDTAVVFQDVKAGGLVALSHSDFLPGEPELIKRA
jgi:hypothetical protein